MYQKMVPNYERVAGAMPVAVERMTGHDVGLSDWYFRPSEALSLAGYVKAIPRLSVSEKWDRRER